MSRKSEIFQNCIRFNMNYNGDTLTYKNKTVQCTASSDTKMSVLVKGGIYENADHKLKVIRSDFATGEEPKSMADLTFRGERFIISKIENDSMNISMTLFCVKPSRALYQR